MIFGELMSALGEKLGIELDSSKGACKLAIDDMDVVIADDAASERVLLSGSIGPTPPDGVEELLSSMLAANHFFAGTGGATISRDPGSGNFYLCRSEPVAMLDGESFMSLVESFVNTLEKWRKLVADYRPTGRAPVRAGKRAAVAEEQAPEEGIGDQFMRV